MKSYLSSTFKSYVKSGGILFYRAVLVLTNGTTLNLDNDDFMQDSWEFQYDSCEGDFEPWGVVASKFTCKLNNTTGKFNDCLTYLNGAKITTFLYRGTIKETVADDGLVTYSITNNEEYCWGTFIATFDEMMGSTLKLDCTDKLSQLKVNALTGKLNNVDHYVKRKAGVIGAYLGYLEDKIPEVSDILTPSRTVSSGTIDGKYLIPQNYNPTSSIGNMTCLFIEMLYLDSYYNKCTVNATDVVKKFLGNTSSSYKLDYTLTEVTSQDWSDITILDIVRYVSQILGCHARLYPRYDYDGGKGSYLVFEAFNPNSVLSVTEQQIKDFSISCTEDKIDSFVVENNSESIPISLFVNHHTSTDGDTTKYLSIDGGHPGVNGADFAFGPCMAYQTPSKKIAWNNGTGKHTIIINKNPLIQLPVSYCYNSENLTFYSKQTTTPSWNPDVTGVFAGMKYLDAPSIFKHYQSDTKIMQLPLRNLDCTTIPFAEVEVGDVVTFTQNGKSMKTVVSHITYKPNVSTKMSNSVNWNVDKKDTTLITTKAQAQSYFTEIAKDILDQFNKNYIDKIFDTKSTAGSITVTWDKNAGKTPPTQTVFKDLMAKFITYLNDNFLKNWTLISWHYQNSDCLFYLNIQEIQGN